MTTTEPAVGDPVILRGRILKLDGGVALVEVYRSYPVGGTVAVQCGALELDESAHDGDTPACKISGEDPYREYQDALAEHARASGLDRERTQRLVDRAWDAYQRHLASLPDEDRIRDAMAEARDHPGRTITR